MVYEIEGRFYIVASGYYREVTIKKENDGYTIVPVDGGKKIIRNIEDGYKQIPVSYTHLTLPTKA